MSGNRTAEESKQAKIQSNIVYERDSADDKGVVVTIFFNGTGSSILDGKPTEWYPDGQVISALRDSVTGLAYGIDGPGSGSPAIPYSEVSQIALGWGVWDNVNLVIHDLVRHVSDGLKIKQVNIAGWSRGGAAGITCASLMYKRESLKNIPVALFAIDPVPGFGNVYRENSQINSNVTQAIFVYAQDERSFGFSAVVPRRTTENTTSKIAYLGMPGHHATVAGNQHYRNTNAEQFGTKVCFPEPGKIVRTLLERFLVKHGTNVKHTLNLSDEELLALFARIKADQKANKYAVLHQESYTTQQKQGAYRKVSQKFGDYLNVYLEDAIDIYSNDDEYVNTLHAVLKKQSSLDLIDKLIDEDPRGFELLERSARMEGRQKLPAEPEEKEETDVTSAIEALERSGIGVASPAHGAVEAEEFGEFQSASEAVDFGEFQSAPAATEAAPAATEAAPAATEAAPAANSDDKGFDELAARHDSDAGFDELAARHDSDAGFDEIASRPVAPAILADNPSETTKFIREASVGDGNCVFNSFVLGLVRPDVLDHIGRQSERLKPFIDAAAEALEAKSRSWVDVRAKIEELRGLSHQPDVSEFGTNVARLFSSGGKALLQKKLARLMRQIAVSELRKNSHAHASIRQGIESAFRDYFQHHVFGLPLNRHTADDIYSRHSFIVSRFKVLVNHFNNLDLSEETERNYLAYGVTYNKLSQKQNRSEAEDRKLAEAQAGIDKLINTYARGIMRWWQSAGFELFLNAMDQTGEWAGDLEVSQLGRYFDINLQILRRGVNKYEINNARGNIPVEGNQAIFTKNVVDQLILRGIVNRSAFSERGVLALEEISYANLNKRLNAVPGCNDIINMLALLPQDKEISNIPFDADKYANIFDELIARNVVTFHKIIDGKKSYRFAGQSPEELLRRIGAIENKEAILQLYRANVKHPPTVSLLHVGGSHYDHLLPAASNPKPAVIPEKLSFFERHPVLTGALIGAALGVGVTLLAFGLTAIVFASGGVAIPLAGLIIAGGIVLASGVVGATAGAVNAMMQEDVVEIQGAVKPALPVATKPVIQPANILDASPKPVQVRPKRSASAPPRMSAAGVFGEDKKDVPTVTTGVSANTTKKFP